MHLNLTTGKQNETEKFFEKVFGWNNGNNSEENQSSEGKRKLTTAFEFEDSPQNTSSSKVINTIKIKNIKSVIRAIEENGGEVITPVMEIPNLGSLAYFRDPDDNTYGLIQEEGL